MKNMLTGGDVLCRTMMMFRVAPTSSLVFNRCTTLKLLIGPKEGTLGGTDENHAGSHRSPDWMQTMSVRWHIIAADKGYLPSFLAIGDAFFYGKGGLLRLVSAQVHGERKDEVA